MIGAIVATHGNLASELIATAKEVYNDVSHCYAVTNMKKSPQALRDELDAILSSAGADDRFVMFVDFFGGSCCHACMAVEMERDNVRLIAGVNLPMLLAFLYKRNEMDFDALVDQLLARGRDSIQLVSAREN